MTTLYVVMQENYIEDYYKVHYMIGVFDDRELAQQWIDKKVFEHQTESWREKKRFEYQSSLNTIIENDPLYIATYAEMISKRDEGKPQFDQLRQRDKEYVLQHTQRKRQWEAELKELSLATREFFKLVPEKVETYMENLIDDENEIRQMTPTSWQSFPSYIIEEQELNNPKE